MKSRLLALCCISLVTNGCIWGDRDFSLSSVSLVEFSDRSEPLRYRLKIEFATAADLQQIMTDGYALHSDGYFCDRPKDYVILMGVDLYFLDQPIVGDVAITRPASSEPLTYSTYMLIAREAVMPSRPPQVSYDLRQHPEDVCFYVVGGAAPVPLGYKSNIIRIPKEAIEAALKSVPGRSN